MEQNMSVYIYQIRSDQLLSRVRLFVTPWIAARQASLSITDSRSSLRLRSIESVMPSTHLILCRPLLLPPIPPSIRVFSNLSTFRMRWPKYCGQRSCIGECNSDLCLLISKRVYRMIYVLCFNTEKHAVPIVESTDNPKEWTWQCNPWMISINSLVGVGVCFPS